jgi:hypothetical protein
MILNFLLYDLQSVVAGHAGDEEIPVSVFLSNGQVSSGKVQGQLFIGAVSRAGTAAGPVLQFVKLEVKEVRYPTDRFVVFPGGPVKGTTRIVGNGFHFFLLIG